MSGREDTIAQLTGNAVLMKRWRELVRSGDLDKILELCNCYRRPYNKDAKPDPIPHIQAEYNGGMKAWDKLEYLLGSLPYAKEKGYEPTSDYVGYTKDRVATRKQENYEDEI
jgi:hypothetical protein